MTGARATVSIRRAHAGPALLALVVAVGAPSEPRDRRARFRRSGSRSRTGCVTWRSAPVEPVTVLDPAGGSLYSLSGPRILRVVPSGTGSTWSARGGSDLRALRFEARGGSLRVGVRDYVGALEVSRQAQGLLLVNELPMEEYVAGTVRGEASERWPAEALRALAVVARTYAVFQQGRTREGRSTWSPATRTRTSRAGWSRGRRPGRPPGPPSGRC